MNNYSIVVHGGAGTISRNRLTPTLEHEYKNALHHALLAGYNMLHEGGNSIDAVEAAVIELENFYLFNAGKGSVFSNKATHEMDAAIMDGKTLNAGSVAGIKRIKNPVMLAKQVMLNSEHILLIGDGAEAFAREQNIEFVNDKYFFTDFQYKQFLNAFNTEGMYRGWMKSENEFFTGIF